jgi:hypothetical protein
LTEVSLKGAKLVIKSLTCIGASKLIAIERLVAEALQIQPQKRQEVLRTWLREVNKLPILSLKLQFFHP